MLVNAAAKRWGVKPEICRTENGYVIAGEKKVSSGKVAKDASLMPKPVVKHREPKAWKYIGKSQKRLDSAEKINSTATYGLDIRFPDLLTAVVAHAPVFGGKVKSFDSSEASTIVGVKQIVQIPTGIAVIADNFWVQKKGGMHCQSSGIMVKMKI
jgi:isoquinoline 1-oxidoreductase beta subunit